MFPPDCLKSVQIYHLPTTAGAKQPYPGTADLTVTGAFLPMDRKEAVMEFGDFVEKYELYLDHSVDVRTGDKFIIDSVVYFAKHLFKANFGMLPHIRVSISSQN